MLDRAKTLRLLTSLSGGQKKINSTSWKLANVKVLLESDLAEDPGKDLSAIFYEELEKFSYGIPPNYHDTLVQQVKHHHFNDFFYL
jgi:hypothetical protein